MTASVQVGVSSASVGGSSAAVAEGKRGPAMGIGFTDTPADRGVSGMVTATLVRHVRARAGDAGVLRMLAIAGEPRPVDRLEDFATWIAHDNAVNLFHAAAQVTGEGEIGLRVGEAILLQYDGSLLAGQLRALGTPQAAAERLVGALPGFTATVEAEAVEVTETGAIARVITRSGTRRHPHLCAFTRGLLSQVPMLFGLAAAQVHEPECQAHGGRFCLYVLSWGLPFAPPGLSGAEPAAWPDVPEALPVPTDRPTPGGDPPDPFDLRIDPDTRIAQLRGQLRLMQERLEGVFSTALELLGEDDIDTLLSRIVSRAARAVSAPRHLLVARTSPASPVQLHHLGFSPSEAEALANELWSSDPDDAGGSRLIVDIASSRRRYGRLAAVFPPGVRYFDSERRMLGLYAGYAAAALDMVSALEEARRSDATARALLGLATSLSQVTTTDGVAQLLADTAPAVTGCRDATVMVWDAARSALTVRGVTSGAVLPEETSGAVVPVDGMTVAASEAGAATNEDSSLLEYLTRTRSVLVVDGSTRDPRLHRLLRLAGATATLVAPLFAGDEFLGVLTANFEGVPATAVRNPDLHRRITALADQGVTALRNVDLLERISHVAWHDSLTGLPNRRLLEDRVEQELARSRRLGESLSVFFVDLDRFKTVNDTLGHAAGDELVRQVGRRLVATVRRQDTVARLGGDEFAVLLPQLAEPAAIDHLAGRCLGALRAPYEIFGRRVDLSASIGIASAPAHGDSYDELLRRADEAMYRSKARGRDTYTTYSEAAPGNDGVDLARDLAHAIDAGELFVLYQPFVDLATTRVIGVEALVRWRHPVLGVLEPRTFIPAIDDTDMVVSLDSWVLDQACRQVRTWIDTGIRTLRLAVNIAPRDLADHDFPRSVLATLRDHRIDPGLLELDVTGGGPTEPAAASATAANVELLRGAGVRLARTDPVDDAAPPGVADALPVVTLAIDRSFVQVLGPEQESATLVSGILGLADRLGLARSIDGGESSRRSRVLLQRGNGTAQGFFFSPPLLPGDVERVLGREPDPPVGPADGGPPSAVPE